MLTRVYRLLQMGAFSDIEVGQYSDFKVKVSTKTFNLHRATVCPQSPFFRAALRPDGFMVSFQMFPILLKHSVVS